MLQFDKSLHPVVLYEYHLICINMNIHENFKKMRENHVKTISLGEGLRFGLFEDNFVSHLGDPNEQFGTHEKLSWGFKVT